VISLIKRLVGTKNVRELKRIAPVVQRINELEPKFKAMSEQELVGMTAEFRRRLDRGQPLDQLIPEAFAAVRESGRRVLEMRHFDVQLIGGMVLHSGKIAEMRTGEGKTLTATLPCYLNALPQKGVHVVTTNDYLARRDAEWMGRIYKHLGLSVGVIVHGLTDQQRQDAYRSDITYGQNNEFGFDYLRDNMKTQPERMVQRGLNYAIVDEVDSILIDEARTPLIISGPAEQSAALYEQVDAIIPRLKKDVDYTVDEKAHSASLTEEGVHRVERLLSIDNLYDPKNLAHNHHVSQALRAHTLYKRDVNYLIEEGKVVIIDEHTGRKMPGRRWSDGLHQAIEAKEHVEIEEENQTLATVTFQNYFRMYNKLSGMTGTADTEAEEFHKIYKLDVVIIPTNRPMIRKDNSDLVYKNERSKFNAVIAEIEDCHKRGQPVLVGTISVEKSVVLSEILKKRNIPHSVLNAKFHEHEASIVAQAGRKGAVTISTNMAGRGTDIVLGGNPEFLAKQAMKAEGVEDPEADPVAFKAEVDKQKAACADEKQHVLGAGGLHILGTERHESRRIDNQLRGRSGRQGDPGSSRFYMSLEDDLLRIFGGDKLTVWMERLGMEDDVPIEHPWVNKAIANAQKRVEGHNFDIRKHLLEYDDVMNQQRKAVYSMRRQVLEGRYAPELSEADLKAGKQPEIPEKSGDWTVESLSQKIRPGVEKHIEKFFAEMQPPGGPLDQPPQPTVPSRRTWRELRHLVWVQYGALVDLEKTYARLEENPDRKPLVDLIVESVAKSIIQQRERIFDLCDQIISSLVEDACPPNTHSDDWDLGVLETQLKEAFGDKVKVPRDLHEAQAIAAAVWKQVEAILEERDTKMSTPLFLYFARSFWLQEIDSGWIDHLKQMEALRDGIGLRGYGQKDPKQEYKKEGYKLFSEMMSSVQKDTARQLFTFEVQVQKEEAVPELKLKEREMVARHGNEVGAGSDQAAEVKPGEEPKPKQQTVRRAEAKVGRNDPCPCGSGKKYKKCHGASAESEA
jgi:preprotein translocase subunit SecA